MLIFAAASLSKLDKFKEAARALERDDDDQRFKDKLKKLVEKPE